MAVAAARGLLLSVPLLRLKGPFFTLASLAFLEVLRLLAVFGRDLTGGSEGLTVPAKEGWLSDVVLGARPVSMDRARDVYDHGSDIGLDVPLQHGVQRPCARSG